MRMCLVILQVSSWNSRKTDDWCSWDGVLCDRVTGHVIGLDLSSSHLYGSINSSSSLFNLVHLQMLNLADNDFNYSQIPPSIRYLSNLTYLLSKRTRRRFWPIIGKMSKSKTKNNIQNLNNCWDHSTFDQLPRDCKLLPMVIILSWSNDKTKRTVHINKTTAIFKP